MTLNHDQLVDACTGFLEDMKVRDLVRLELPGHDLFDTFLIATCTSSRHLKSTADRVYVECKKLGELPGHAESGENWQVIDLNRLLVHLFTEEARDRYALERLWEGSGPDPDAIERTLEWETRTPLDR